MNRRELLKALTVMGLGALVPDSASAVFVPVVRNIRYSAGKEKTRIVFDCTGRVVKENIVTKVRGKTLILDVRNLSARRTRKALKSQLVSGVELVPISRRLLRIKIHMRTPRKFHIFALKPCSGKPFRVVVDVFRDFLITECMVKKRRVVVIDPGHGGKDPGAVWPTWSRRPRIREKDITLSIGLKLARLLKSKAGVDVILTRRRDTYVPLIRRAEIPAKVCADAFVSIHADSMPRFPNWSGVTVFKASPRLFSRAQLLGRSVAKRVHVCNDAMCWSLTPLIVNMATAVTFAESEKLARAIVKNLKAHVNEELVNGIRDMKRNIIVLKMPGRPAVLVESGFITNPKDRRRLLQHRYQEEIARGIAKGVIDYLESLGTVTMVG